MYFLCRITVICVCLFVVWSQVMWPRSEEERGRKRNCGFVSFKKRVDAEDAKVRWWPQSSGAVASVELRIRMNCSVCSVAALVDKLGCSMLL